MADTIFTSALLKLSDARSIHIVTRRGHVTVGSRKNGEPDISSYPAGSFVLKDEKEGVIAGPIDVGGAVDLARAIVTGNRRAVTEPQALIILATAILGLAGCLPLDTMPVALEFAALDALEKAAV